MAVGKPNHLERGLAVLALAVVTGALALATVLAGQSNAFEPAEALLWSLVILPWAVVGTLLLLRVPGSRVAWLCLLFAASWALWVPLEAATGLATAGPRVVTLYALGDSLWVPGVASVGFLLLLFPDGRLPSPRWRPVAFGMVVISILLVITGLITPGPINEVVTWENPFGVEAFAPLIPVSYALVPLLAICLLASGAGLVVRYRHSAGVEKAQLKWLAAAGAVSAVGYLIWLILALAAGIETSPQVVWIIIPIAVWFSITRHRLYDLDSLLSRTVGYALVAGLLGGAYAGAVFLLGQVTPLDGDLAVALSTLGAAALFNPLRRRVLRAVERRFNRTRFDSEAVAERLNGLLSTSYDPDQVAGAWNDVVTETMNPATVGLWIRPRERPR